MSGKIGRIYQRGPMWYVDVPNPDGTRFRRSVGRNRHQAERVLANKRADLREAGAMVEEPDLDPTVASCWNYYIERMVEESKPASVLNIKTNRKRWADIERKHVSRLKQDDINSIMDKMPGKPTTKNVAIKLLRAALRRSKRDKRITSIPVELDERKHVVPLPITVSKQEFRALLAACKNYRAKTLITLAMYGGLRHAECRHLTLSDINFGTMLLSITAKPEYGWSPKNYEEREIPIAPILEQTLKNHIAAMPKRSAALDELGSPRWLFPARPGNKPLTQVNTGRLVSAAYEGANIGGNRPGLHRLRKSWATNVLKTAGLGVLMRLGGWNSLETVKRYIGTDTDAARAAIESLDF